MRTNDCLMFILFFEIIVTILLGAVYNEVLAIHELMAGTSVVESVKTIVEPVEPEKEVFEEAEAESDSIVIELEEKAYYNVPLDKDVQDHLMAMCDIYKIDPEIVVAMIERESDFRTDVVGDNGYSFGLMQIQERWHKDRMKKLDCADLLDPYQNIMVGVDLFAELIGRGNGIEWALMAYNGGPSYANKLTNKGVVSEYAQEVMVRADELALEVVI